MHKEEMSVLEGAVNAVRWITRRSKGEDPFDEGRDIPRDNQSVEVSEGVYRDARHTDEFVSDMNGVCTLHDLFETSCSQYAENKMYGQRCINEDESRGEYEWLTYAEVKAKVMRISSGLVHAGVSPRATVALYSKNRVEWQLASHVCARQGFLQTALYDTLGKGSGEYILQHANVQAVFFSKELFEKVIPLLSSENNVDIIVQFEQITPSQREMIPTHVKAFSLSELEEQGRLESVSPDPVGPDDVAVLMYTSGTTGVPKAVPLTNRNCISVSAAIAERVFPIQQEDIMFSFLPLAHIFARVGELFIIAHGSRVGYYSGNPRELSKDAALLKPTIIISVPRIFEMIQEKVLAELDKASKMKQWLFDVFFRAKKAALKAGHNTSFYDKVVFDKVKNQLGGHLRMMVVGAAALRPEVQEFITVAFGCPVCFGFGMTESAAGVCVQYPELSLEIGNVGPPVGSVEVKLHDVPEMNYLHTNDPPQGELWVRGMNIVKEYVGLPDKSAEVFVDDGWCRTGDVAQRNKDGSFKIIDRVKNIVKLSQGEYVALERVETILGASRYVDQLWVYGDVFQRHIIAIGVVNVDCANKWASDNYVSVRDVSEFCDMKKFNEVVVEDLKKQHRAAHMNRLEMPASVFLTTDRFSIENKTMTPTMKLCRPELQKIYKEKIEEIYKSISS